MAKAIVKLADKATEAIETGEEREQARTRRDRVLVAVSVLSTVVVAIAAFSIHRLVEPVIPELGRFSVTMIKWEASANESKRRQETMEVELVKNTEISRDLAVSVSALVASSVTKDVVKKKELTQRAEVKAVQAAGKATRAIIETAERRQKPPPAEALAELQGLKEKAAVLKKTAPDIPIDKF